MIETLTTYIWTCEKCKNSSPNNIWKWEIKVNPLSVFDKQKLEYMKYLMTNHVLKNNHEVVLRQNEPKVGRSIN